MSRISWSRVLALSVALGCAGKGEEDPAEHACEAVEAGGAALDAAEAPEDAPGIEIGEEGYVVTLPASGTGYVHVDVAEAADALLFLDAADVLTAIAHDGVDEGLPTPSPNEFCEDALPEHFDLALEPGEWTFTLGPSAATEVWLLLISAEGHGHGDEGDDHDHE